jgi:hypothetical protein
MIWLEKAQETPYGVGFDHSALSSFVFTIKLTIWFCTYPVMALGGTH